MKNLLHGFLVQTKTGRFPLISLYLLTKWEAKNYISFQEYLRSIPGQLLLSGNFQLWMEVCDEPDTMKRLRMCRNLLRLLPPSHTVLLKSVLRLMRRIASMQTSKMTIRSLAVCIAPSLLENPSKALKFQNREF